MLTNDDKLAFLKKDGTFYFPTASGPDKQPVTEDIAIPLGAQGSTTTVTTAGYFKSGRIWYAQGTLQFTVNLPQGATTTQLGQPSPSDPNDASANVNWGFVELSFVSKDVGVFANVSYVDFVGLVASLQLQNTAGTVTNAKGLPNNAIPAICSALNAQGQKDGQPWGSLCKAGSDGQTLRILNPNDYLVTNPQAFATYWNDYVNQVWTKYTSQPLKVDTQNFGVVNCQVTGDTMNCANDPTPIGKPNALDIFGCNTGPFAPAGSDSHKAIQARICAAINRSTLLLNGGDTQPSLLSPNYYTVDPTNYYSKIVHQNEIDGRGYAFSYDDVYAQKSDDQSGFVTDANPTLLTITVGGVSA